MIDVFLSVMSLLYNSWGRWNRSILFLLWNLRVHLMVFCHNRVLSMGEKFIVVYPFFARVLSEAGIGILLKKGLITGLP